MVAVRLFIFCHNLPLIVLSSEDWSHPILSRRAQVYVEFTFPHCANLHGSIPEYVYISTRKGCFHLRFIYSATPPHLRTQSAWEQFNSISNVVLSLRRALPPPSDPRGTEPLETVGRANPDLVHAHIELQAATVLLSNAAMDTPDLWSGNEAAMEAASSAAALMQLASGEGGVLTAIQAPVSLLVRFFCASDLESAKVFAIILLTSDITCLYIALSIHRLRSAGAGYWGIPEQFAKRAGPVFPPGHS